MPQEISGEIEIVPGVIGPARILKVPTTEGGISYQLDIRFDNELGRYVCHEFRAFRAEKGSPVTTEALREVAITEEIAGTLLLSGEFRDLENPDGREPWGQTAPEDVAKAGPTDRALRWVAHLYRFGFAISVGPAVSVEGALGLPRSTTGRWIAMARDAGYLRHAEGPGKAGG